MNIGVNLFGIGKHMTDDFSSDLDRLKDIGFSSIEPLVVFLSGFNQGLRQQYGNSDISMSKSMWTDIHAYDKISLIKEKGFDVQSVHIMGCEMFPKLIEVMLPAILDFGKKTEVNNFVVSYNKSTVDEIKPFISFINSVATTLKKSGMQLVLHNHENELTSIDGVTVIDYIFENCPDIKLQLDVGWVQFANISPVSLMKKYKARLVSLHLKDISADANADNRETCFRAIGEGCIPLFDIIEKAIEYNLAENALIIDQDDTLGDMFDDLSLGVKNIKVIADGFKNE